MWYTHVVGVTDNQSRCFNYSTEEAMGKQMLFIFTFPFEN